MAKKNSSVAKIFEPNKKKIITAFIATPALHGNVEAHYVASITEAYCYTSTTWKCRSSLCSINN
jgi:hypothetical protein